MISFTFFACALTAIALLNNAHAQTFRLGNRCPSAPAMDNFDMNRFVGVWYAIEKSHSIADNCLLFNITQPDPVHHPNEYQVQQTSLVLRSSRQEMVWMLNLGTDSTASSRMTVNVPSNAFGGSSFEVFDTDYTTYAGLYTCKSLLFFNRQSAILLSRTKTLDARIARKLRHQLYDHNIFSLDLRVVLHQGCAAYIPEEDEI